MPAPSAEAAPALRLDEVVAGYGESTVLDGLSLTIRPGEAYALLGSNGAGKSTAARIACGLMTPRSGTVSVAGGGVGGSRQKGRIGLAPQDCALFGALSIRENLETFARLGGIARGARAAAIARALALASCADRADERVGVLSGGWRRRANLAGALVCRPALLVLDEPTEGVDAATRTHLALGLWAALADGAGCLIISHDAAFVAVAASFIGVLSKGRLVAEGPPAQLLTDAFGAARRLTLRFPVRPPEALQARMQSCGLVGEADTVTWRRLGDDVEGVAAALSGAVQDAGGELSIRRPDLDDLLARLTGRVA